MAASEVAGPDIALDELTDHIVSRIAVHLDLEDLLRLSRVSRRYRRVVLEAEDAWQRLYAATFPSSDSQGSGGGAGSPAAGAQAPGVLPAAGSGTWRQRFRDRYVEARQRTRLRRIALLQRRQSAVQLLQQERHRLRQALRQEKEERGRLRQQLAALRQASQEATQEQQRARIAELYWQPVAVARAQGLVTTQAPLDAAARMADLEQRAAVSDLELRKLTAALAANERRLGEARRKLQQLQP